MNDNQNIEDIKLWVLKSVIDDERSYKTIESYKDKIDQAYNYDSKVANFRQIKSGDFALLINKSNILGLAKIKEIIESTDTKIIRKCPDCGSSTIDTRKTILPKYRCNNGHSFEMPIEKAVLIQKFSANYQDFFIKYTDNKVLLSDLRPFYTNGYNQNMSMQLLDFKALNLLPVMYQDFLSNYQLLKVPPLPYQGDILIDPSRQFYVPNYTDEREILFSQIRARRGQQKFRDSLRKIYGDICVISGCSVLDVLEAAHINPYRGKNDNHPANGLLLRADIHTLYDLNLIGVEPDSLQIFINVKLKDTEYEKYINKTILFRNSKPSINSLKDRWEQFLITASEGFLGNSK